MSVLKLFANKNCLLKRIYGSGGTLLTCKYHCNRSIKPPYFLPVKYFSNINTHKQWLNEVQSKDFDDIDSVVEYCRQKIDADLQNSFEEVKFKLEIAASQDSQVAQYLLGFILSIGSTVVESIKDASSADEVVKQIKRIQQSIIEERKLKKRVLKGSPDNSKTILDTANITMSKEEQAIMWLTKASKKNHGPSMTLLANILMSKNDKISVFEAISWYKKAAQLDYTSSNAEALFSLGTLYYQGSKSCGIVSNLEISFGYFKSAADLASNSDPSASFWVGYCYATGEGGAEHIDPLLAKSYLEQAVVKQHPMADYLLATLYRTGLEYDETNRICINPNLFKYHLLSAVGNDDPEAIFCLADLLFNGPEVSLKQISEEFSPSGTLQASSLVHKCQRYVDMSKVIFSIDQNVAIEWYKKASNLGHIQATLSLAAIYYHGYANVARDAHMAFKLYNEAAEQGNEDAWKNLAKMYWLGDGVQKCESTALEIMRVIFGKSYDLGKDEPRKHN